MINHKLLHERYAGTYAIGKRAVIEVGGTRSKVFCGCCHHSLSRIAQKTPFFMCRHSQAGPSSRCHSLRVNAAELEQAVFQTLKKQL